MCRDRGRSLPIFVTRVEHIWLILYKRIVWNDGALVVDFTEGDGRVCFEANLFWPLLLGRESWCSTVSAVERRPVRKRLFTPLFFFLVFFLCSSSYFFPNRKWGVFPRWKLHNGRSARRAARSVFVRALQLTLSRWPFPKGHRATSPALEPSQSLSLFLLFPSLLSPFLSRLSIKPGNMDVDGRIHQAFFFFSRSLSIYPPRSTLLFLYHIIFYHSTIFFSIIKSSAGSLATTTETRRRERKSTTGSPFFFRRHLKHPPSKQGRYYYY